MCEHADDPLSTNANVFKKLTFLIPWYAHVHVRIRRFEKCETFCVSTNWTMPFKKYHSKIYRNNCPEVFRKEDVLKKFANFPGKHLCWSFLFDEVGGLRSATLSKKRFRHRCFLWTSQKFYEYLFCRTYANSYFWI